MRWHTIGQYVGYALPILKQWGQQGDSLRGITVEDVRSAIKNQPGPGHQQLGALRSLFRALKRERLIFQAPTRHVRLAGIVSHPVPLPTDRLRGLLNRASGTQATLAVALVAVHALYGRELRHLQVTDLDRTNGRLTTRRHHGTRTVILDELTLGLAADWIRERATFAQVSRETTDAAATSRAAATGALPASAHNRIAHGPESTAQPVSGS
jgi:integrase